MRASNSPNIPREAYRPSVMDERTRCRTARTTETTEIPMPLQVAGTAQILRRPADDRAASHE
jgi:hypothetical protein